MSLSKPVAFDKISYPPSPTQQYSLSRGIQIGIAIGIPVAAIAVGFCWWKGVFSSSNSDTTKPDLKEDNQNQNQTSNENISIGRKEDTRPLYARLKEEGNERFKKGEFTKALELYQKATEESPPVQLLAALYQNRAAVFEKLGDWVQVINESTAALKLDPRYIKALSRRSKAYRQTGFVDEALEDITAVCVLEQFSSHSSIQTADEVLKEVGKKEAERLIKEKKPFAPSKHSVNAFLRAFHSDPVTKWWNGTSKLPMLNGDANDDEENGNGSTASLKGFPAAVEAIRSQEYDNILELCSEEIESKGKFVDEAYLVRGTFRHLWGYQNETIEDFKHVIESKNASKELKASAYIKIGAQASMQIDGIPEQYFEKAENLCPDNVDVYHQRGQTLLTKGDFHGAITQIDKANEICSDFALVAASKWFVEYRIASLTNNEMGIATALKNFNKCLRKFDKSPEVFNLYGQLLMEMGRFQEAIAQFDYVSQLDPTNAAIYVHKAVAKYQMEGDVSKILPMLRDSLKIDDKNEFVYETIGTLELQTGNLESAVEAITKALTLAKTFQELMMLSSLKKAAEVQFAVRAKYNIDVPPPGSFGNLEF